MLVKAGWFVRRRDRARLAAFVPRLTALAHAGLKKAEDRPYLATALELNPIRGKRVVARTLTANNGPNPQRQPCMWVSLEIRRLELLTCIAFLEQR